jgi:hypothetical protein
VMSTGATCLIGTATILVVVARRRHRERRGPICPSALAER